MRRVSAGEVIWARGFFYTDEQGTAAYNKRNWKVQESDVVAPSEMIGLADPFSRSEDFENNGFYAFPGGAFPIPKGFKNRLAPPAQANQDCMKLHGSQYNRFYVDGHLEAENFRKPFVATDDYLARWNTDHQPHRNFWLRW